MNLSHESVCTATIEGNHVSLRKIWYLDLKYSHVKMFPGMCSGYGIYVFMTDTLNKGILYVQND